jgi:hypothetical protein
VGRIAQSLRNQKAKLGSNKVSSSCARIDLIVISAPPAMTVQWICQIEANLYSLERAPSFGA